MFTSLLSHKKTGKTLAAFMVLLTTAFVFSTLSCKQTTDNSDDASIYGTWTSSYDSYVITSSTVTYNDGGYGYGWTGSLASVSAMDSTSGYVYIQYTSVGKGLSSSLVGKYNAFAYKNLGSSAVQMANAYKSGGAESESSLSAAVTEFTISNGYYSYFGSYTK
jgi:hypothetical protein